MCDKNDPIKCECPLDTKPIEEEVSDSESVTTEDVLNVLRPNWPRIHLEVDLPGWFILVSALILGLRARNECLT